MSVTAISISPVARLGLTFSGARLLTVPAAVMTSSERSLCASAWAVAGGGGVEDELHDPRALAQVDEDQAAVVAAAMHPARYARGRARPLGVELTGPAIAKRVGARRVLHATRLPRRIVGMTASGDELGLISRLHVLEADLHGVADDRNVARSEAVCVLELALEPAAGQLQLGAQTRPARLIGELEAGVMRLDGVTRGDGHEQVHDMGREPAARRQPAASAPRPRPIRPRVSARRPAAR